MPFKTRNFWHGALRSTLIALAAQGAHDAAQAQSGYTLTTLQAPSFKPIFPAAIDTQNRVFGTTDYLTGFGLLPDFSGFGWLYSTYAVRWPASSAASVAASKVTGSQTGGLRAASEDGNTIVLALGLALVYDTPTGKLTSMLSYPKIAGTSTPVNASQVTGISNAGVMAVNYTVDGSLPPNNARTGLWKTDADGQALPFGGYAGAQSISVNGQGKVSGAIYEQGVANLRAAVWANGGLTVIDHTPGRGSAALASNQTGQVLMRVNPMTVYSYTGDNGIVYSSPVYGAPTYVVSLNGVETQINPVNGHAVVVPSAINGSGVVVGRMGAVGAPNPYLGPTPIMIASVDAVPGRAFIWKNGVTTDLTTLVASKGVKLPTGAVLDDAIAINDQGSILAKLRAANGTISFVRLTAKP